MQLLLSSWLFQGDLHTLTLIFVILLVFYMKCSYFLSAVARGVAPLASWLLVANRFIFFSYVVVVFIFLITKELLSVGAVARGVAPLDRWLLVAQ